MKVKTKKVTRLLFCVSSQLKSPNYAIIFQVPYKKIKQPPENFLNCRNSPHPQNLL